MRSDQAYILHKRLYKDSSELIKLYTEKHGIVDVIGKGSRRPKSKVKGQLQAFIPTQVTFSGKSTLKTLINAEQTGVLKPTNYLNHVSLLYCNELMVLLNLDVELASLLFEQYQHTISSIQNTPTVSLVLRQFEWYICCAIGYELTVPENSINTNYLSFDPIHGLVIDDKTKTCQQLAFDKFINKQPLTKSELLQINRLMKCVVDHIVNGKTIQSRSLLMI